MSAAEDRRRKADAEERARLKAEARKGKEAHISMLWLCGEKDMNVIAERVGCSAQHVSEVLDALGLRPKQTQRVNRRRTVGAIIEKVRES